MVFICTKYSDCISVYDSDTFEELEFHSFNIDDNERYINQILYPPVVEFEMILIIFYNKTLKKTELITFDYINNNIINIIYVDFMYIFAKFSPDGNYLLIKSEDELIINKYYPNGIVSIDEQTIFEYPTKFFINDFIITNDNYVLFHNKNKKIYKLNILTLELEDLINDVEKFNIFNFSHNFNKLIIAGYTWGYESSYIEIFNYDNLIKIYDWDSESYSIECVDISETMPIFAYTGNEDVVIVNYENENSKLILENQKLIGTIKFDNNSNKLFIMCDGTIKIFNIINIETLDVEEILEFTDTNIDNQYIEFSPLESLQLW